jgi:NAD(P)-dependent dehydrogenase (short-subunit alcohol dehydrogenase family)
MVSAAEQDLRDRGAIVTGAAQGIGRATALLLVARGARVIAWDVDEAALGTLAQRVEGITPVSVDVRDRGQVEERAQQAQAAEGRIDILVNVVGGSTGTTSARASFGELSDEDWQTLLDLNLRSTVTCCRAVLPGMRERRYGRVVNVSSVAARRSGSPASPAYAAAKGAVSALTRALAGEAGPDGVTCNAVAPGLILTERVWRTSWESRSAEERQAMVAPIPLGRPGTPEDVAAAIAFLASDEARYITGVTLDVNGGAYMGL